MDLLMFLGVFWLLLFYGFFCFFLINLHFDLYCFFTLIVSSRGPATGSELSEVCLCGERKTGAQLGGQQLGVTRLEDPAPGAVKQL